MRFLIVDETSEFRRALGAMLRARWPEAQVDEWDPRSQGNPAAVVAREPYSAVLLDCHPAGEDGIRWVAELRREADAPPVVLIADQGDTHVAIQALKAGAADFLRRTGLTPERLAKSLEHALREREARRMELAAPGASYTPTVPIVPRQIGAPVKDDAVRVAGYRALRQIGQGGMAQVFLAEREKDGLQMVLKVLDRALRRDGTFLQRFAREYQLIASLQEDARPGGGVVARIYDHGFYGEHPYIAMEFLSGGTLAARIHEGLTSLEALRITSQIAAALEVIHGHDIIHRDLKPPNIMFRDNGRPVLVDFGLAKDLSSNTALTRHGEIMATPRYMSPEQCLAQPVDHRTDLYSLGAIFYELLTGRRVYEGEGPAALVYAHVQGPIPQLPERLAGYQPILDRLMAKSPADRFQSARELFDTIAV
jgi:DNA-binding response OmpR family regulator